jgi:hypothetical protein
MRPYQLQVIRYFLHVRHQTIRADIREAEARSRVAAFKFFFGEMVGDIHQSLSLL